MSLTAYLSLPLHWYLVKLFSLILIVFGLYGITLEVIEIFYKYPELSQAYIKSHFDPSMDLYLLKRAFFLSTSNFLATTYGAIMLLKPPHLIETAHIIIGIIIFAFSAIFINHYEVTPELIQYVGGLLIR